LPEFLLKAVFKKESLKGAGLIGFALTLGISLIQNHSRTNLILVAHFVFLGTRFILVSDWTVV